MTLVHLLWAFGLQAWIATCVAALVVIGVQCFCEIRRERRGDPW